jgi:hypothetical protein
VLCLKPDTGNRLAVRPRRLGPWNLKTWTPLSEVCDVVVATSLSGMKIFLDDATAVAPTDEPQKLKTGTGCLFAVDERALDEYGRSNAHGTLFFLTIHPSFGVFVQERRRVRLSLPQKTRWALNRRR